MEFKDCLESSKKTFYHSEKIEDLDGIFVTDKYPENLYTKKIVPEDWLYFIRIINEESEISWYAGYCKEENGNYITESTMHSKRIKFPLNIESHNEYIFDSNQIIQNKNKSPIAFDELLTRIYNEHVKPLKFFFGFILRQKLRIRKYLSFLLKNFYEILNIIHYILTGFKFKNDIETQHWNSKINQKIEIELEPTATKPMTFLGISVHPVFITFYCLMHILGYTIFYLLNVFPDYIRIILKYNLLTLVYVFASFSILGSLIPKVINKLLKPLINLHYKIKYGTIKI